MSLRELLFIFVLLFCPLTTVQGEVLRIDQAVDNLPMLKLYLTLESDNGTPVTDVDKDDFGVFLNGRSLPISEITRFDHSDEGVAVTVLLDISKTMRKKQNGLEPFSQAVAAVEQLIQITDEKDKMALLTFGDKVTVVQPFTGDKELLRDKLATLQPDDNLTALNQGYSRAMELNRQRGGNIPDRRAIFVISDGKDEGSGIQLDDVLAMPDNTVPIYSVGYTRLSPPDDQNFLNQLKRASLLTGGSHIRSPKAVDLPDTLAAVFRKLKMQWLLQVDTGLNQELSEQAMIKVTYSVSSVSTSIEKRVRMSHVAVVESVPVEEPVLTPQPPSDELPSDVQSAPSSSGNKLLYLVAALCFLALSTLAFLYYQKKKQAEPEPDFSLDAGTNIDGQLPPVSRGSGPIHSSSLAPVGRLIVISGSTALPEYPVFPETTIGRSEKNSIQLSRQDISAMHCIIRMKDDVFVLEDAGSTNGTLLNGTRVQNPTRLRDNDIISIAGCRMRFVLQ